MTHLATWLREHGRTTIWLARELGISKDAIYLLATPLAQKRLFLSFRFDTLTAVYELTGIEQWTLIRDVYEAGQQHGE